jgi:hypothetical protein
MCRNIKTLRAPYAVGVTDDDVRAAALQYVRTVGGFRLPSPDNADAFNEAVDTIAAATRDLLTRLGASPEHSGGLADLVSARRSRPSRPGQAVGVRLTSPRPSSLTETSRMTNFCTFPVTVIGKASVIRR